MTNLQYTKLGVQLSSIVTCQLCSNTAETHKNCQVINTRYETKVLGLNYQYKEDCIEHELETDINNQQRQ